MKRKLNNILITGGAGFIGSNFIHLLLSKKDFSGKVINFDKLTYAGDLKNLEGLPESATSRYHFVKGDINDEALFKQTLVDHDVDTIIHMAAESHVDRSIESPLEFITTNVVGTYKVLQCAKEFWGDRKDVLFHHVSTDEVFGSLGDTGYFTETTSYDPRSPYSSSKASSDHFVRSYFHTYGLPVTISNCSNNYGPRQNREKLIPLMITNILEKKPLPVYGKGLNIRDWIFVDDHNEGILTIIKNGKVGETYNLGGNNEVRNIDMVEKLCDKVATKKGGGIANAKELITYVPDRLGHDFRYAIDNTKAKSELNWEPKESFDSGIDKTIDWYLTK
jgi:dTDP-glucose 4,6-dehydratase